jgi:type IV pilus assembly protein PilW
MSTKAIKRHRASRRQRGFTMIELMIAMTVALFLIGGLLMLLQNVGGTHRNQTALAQLQDSQRVAMTLITEVVESAGYFPDPTTNTLALSLPATTIAGATVATGQSLYGTYTSADPGDTLSVRFTTASNDTIINCVGGTNSSGAVAYYVNTFSVNAGRLMCSLNGADPVALVDGIQRMEIHYGVKRDMTVDNNNVDTYLRADEMTAADWVNASSVRVQLTFINPLAKQPGQPETIVFTRTVAIMNRAGVKL